MAMTTAEKLIGQDVKGYCGKCKAETLHTVTTVKEDKIARVMCNVCNNYHNFRKLDEETMAATKKKAAKKATKKTTTKKKVTRRRKVDWGTLISDLQDKEISDYTASEDFRETKAIRHKSYGVGVITKQLDYTKFEVVFEDGIKMLGQNIDFSD